MFSSALVSFIRSESHCPFSPSRKFPSYRLTVPLSRLDASEFFACTPFFVRLHGEGPPLPFHSTASLLPHPQSSENVLERSPPFVPFFFPLKMAANSRFAEWTPFPPVKPARRACLISALAGVSHDSPLLRELLPSHILWTSLGAPFWLALPEATVWDLSASRAGPIFPLRFHPGGPPFFLRPDEVPFFGSARQQPLPVKSVPVSSPPRDFFFSRWGTPLFVNLPLRLVFGSGSRSAPSCCALFPGGLFFFLLLPSFLEQMGFFLALYCGPSLIQPPVSFFPLKSPLFSRIPPPLRGFTQ